MHVLFIWAIVLGVIGISLIVSAITVPDRPERRWKALLFGGVVAIFVCALLAAAGADLTDQQYNEETNTLCTKKGGVVTKDNHCFVDNKPVEFSPGVWQR